MIKLMLKLRIIAPMLLCVTIAGCDQIPTYACNAVRASCALVLPMYEGQPLERDGIFYAINSNVPLNANVRWFHENGQLEAEFTVIDGRQEGLYQRWYENGQLFIEKKTGEQVTIKIWNVKGQLRSDTMEVDGKMAGVYQTWHTNGRLESKGHYLGDEKEGLDERWFASGQLRSKVTYVSGKKEGWYQHYDIQGRELTAICYRADEATGHSYCAGN
jgi:antitoxin component YwqK of YwqJK toxin-antitoxin module